MKQNITVEQIKQLSIKELNKIVVLLDIEPYYRRAKMHTLVYENDVLKYIAECATIGKMIEVLEENNCLKLEQENIIPNDSDYGLKWVVEIFHDIDCEIKHFESEELCDALWEAVKLVV